MSTNNLKNFKAGDWVYPEYNFLSLAYVIAKRKGRYYCLFDDGAVGWYSGWYSLEEMRRRFHPTTDKKNRFSVEMVLLRGLEKNHIDNLTYVELVASMRGL